MSITLFEIQRIWDVWPNIRNQQFLRDLFRQLLATSSQDLKISNVFVIPGHIFVAVSPKDGVEPRGRASLYVFSCAPLVDAQSHDSHVTTTACLLELSRQCTDVLNVYDGSKEGREQVYVVQNNGELSTFVYNTIKQLWTLNESCQFTSKTSGVVCSCCFMTTPNSSRQNSRVLLYCARSPSSSSSSATPSSTPSQASYDYQVILRRCEITPGGSFGMGSSTVLLECCPLFDLVGFSDGVCFVPVQGPYPEGLLLFWISEKDRDKHGSEGFGMRAYIWNLATPTPSPYPSSALASDPLNFKTTVLCLASTWSKVQREPYLVSLTAHPVTNQLLALDSVGKIHSFTLAITGTIKRQLVASLTDFSLGPSPSPSPGPGLFSPDPTTAQPQLFCFYSCYGIVRSGDIRLYDCSSGEFLWESNEHDGVGLEFWSMPKSPGCCGLYGNSGMWIIRSQKVSDHAHFLARGLFPVRTNADETTPGDCLDEGQLLAAKLCAQWGHNLLATKYALEAAYELVKHPSKKSKGNSMKQNPLHVPQVPTELISLLDQKSSLQNPALLVALLSEFPLYRPDLTKRVERFLEGYSTTVTEGCVNDLMTPLNKELVPLLEKYVELSREREALFTKTSLSHATPSTVRTSVCELLRRCEHVSESTVEANDSMSSQLRSICKCHPQEALLGIKDFFNITSFHDAVKALDSGQWQSQRNWKDIFATELAAGVEKSYLKDTTNHIPIFEETCRLLYRLHPDELLAFVNFAQLARDHQAQGDSAFARKCRKDFFYRRAIDALPKFGCVEDAPTSSAAVRVYCQLLLNSDHPNSDMLTVKLLLDKHLWEDAIRLVEETSTQDNKCFIFHTLLAGLNEGGVLPLYIDRTWNLLPQQFNVFDFLNIMKNQPSPASSGVLVNDETSMLKVSAVTSKLLDLLAQATRQNLSSPQET